MNAESSPQWMRRAAARLQARLAILGTCAGAALGVSTVILSAINAISAQQAIAMALSANVALIGGLLRTIILDPRTAWQRGFQQGYQIRVPHQPSGPDPRVAAVPGHDDVGKAGRPASPMARAGLRRVL
jgi:hypothetical protein